MTPEGENELPAGEIGNGVIESLLGGAVDQPRERFMTSGHIKMDLSNVPAAGTFTTSYVRKRTASALPLSRGMRPNLHHFAGAHSSSHHFTPARAFSSGGYKAPRGYQAV